MPIYRARILRVQSSELRNRSVEVIRRSREILQQSRGLKEKLKSRSARGRFSLLKIPRTLRGTRANAVSEDCEWNWCQIPS